ncbi:hypothetical protein BaRGS_00022844, partial [Batillaria attramentaria]
MWKGFRLPYFEDDLDTHFEKVHNMQLRNDDVLLCSYPKSGTHWVWRILDLLTHESADYGDRYFTHGLLDMQRVDRLNNMAPPRVLTTHLPLQFLPRQVKDKRTRIVHMYRNPKALITSMYFMLKDSGLQPDLTLDEAVDRCGAMTEFVKSNPEVPVYHMAYEDLKMNTVGAVQELARFLGLSPSPGLCEQIADAVSFQKQKQEEDKKTREAERVYNIFRKGDMDDWKNHMTVAQSERMDQMLKDRADSVSGALKTAIFFFNLRRINASFESLKCAGTVVGLNHLPLTSSALM